MASTATNAGLSKEDLKRQIATLQAQLATAPASPPKKRRKTQEYRVLAPATPSPRKKKGTVVDKGCEREGSPTPMHKAGQGPFHHAATSSKSMEATGAKKEDVQAISTPMPSLVQQLKNLRPSAHEEREPIMRTEGFAEKPAVVPTLSSASTSIPARDERLAIIEDLELGPVEHKPTADDPKFETIEPNSGIKLKSRVLSHDALQDHLTGRYFLPPSLLYSVVRLEPNRLAYEVPVEGDWVTIAVVVERGDIKLTSGPGNAMHGKRPEKDNFDHETEGNLKEKKSSASRKDGNAKSRNGEEEGEPQNARKKYVHLRLVDLGYRSRSASSSDQRGTLRGDAQLSLLLFESDYYDKLIFREDGIENIQKLWKGGSGGAFEECLAKLREGTVIALLNPKVLKPFQNTKSPASLSILALTPSSASAIAIIGYAADLGLCSVLKRDGKPCGAWVDRRASSRSGSGDVCEYHVQTAVQRTRAGRAEFSIGTSGMSTAAHKRRPDYDPARQWGLKPESGAGVRGPDGEATYVVSGHVASTSKATSLAVGIIGDTIGREGHARAKRRGGASEEARLLEELVGRGAGCLGEGAREAVGVVLRAKEAVAGKVGKSTALSEGESAATNGLPKKKKYSAEMVKALGFDPTLGPYGAVENPGAKAAKMEKFGKLLQGEKREIRLGPPPGKKVRSGIVIPPDKGNLTPEETGNAGAHGSDSEDELISCNRNGGRAAAGHYTDDSSESGLEIEPPSVAQVIRHVVSENNHLNHLES